jgi:hypothetical protein
VALIDHRVAGDLGRWRHPLLPACSHDRCGERRRVGSSIGLGHGRLVVVTVERVVDRVTVVRVLFARDGLAGVVTHAAPDQTRRRLDGDMHPHRGRSRQMMGFCDRVVSADRGATVAADRDRGNGATLLGTVEAIHLISFVSSAEGPGFHQPPIHGLPVAPADGAGPVMTIQTRAFSPPRTSASPRSVAGDNV